MERRSSCYGPAGRAVVVLMAAFVADAVDIRSHPGRTTVRWQLIHRRHRSNAALRRCHPFGGDQLLALPWHAYLYSTRAPLSPGHTLCVGHETKR